MSTTSIRESRPPLNHAPAVPAAPAEVSSSGGGRDRRRSHREPVVTTGTIKPVDYKESAPPRQVLVTDVSLHGVGLRSPADLITGTRYFIEIGVGPLYLSSRMTVVRSF